jgi:hypothetical protein
MHPWLEVRRHQTDQGICLGRMRHNQLSTERGKTRIRELGQT